MADDDRRAGIERLAAAISVAVSEPRGPRGGYQGGVAGDSRGTVHDPRPYRGHYRRLSLPCPVPAGRGDVMADDERRAEIEAVAKVIHPRFDEYSERIKLVWLHEADQAIAALDRVRDARDDNETVTWSRLREAVRRYVDEARELGSRPDVDEMFDVLMEEFGSLPRDARDDNEIPRLVVDWTEDGQGIVLDTATDPARVVGTHSEPPPKLAARSPQDEDHETDQ